MVEKNPQRHHGAGEVHAHLDEVDPDDRLDAADVGVKRRRRSEEEDRDPDGNSEDEGNRDRRHREARLAQ